MKADAELSGEGPGIEECEAEKKEAMTCDLFGGPRPRPNRRHVGGS
jgi:hypothetical protein